MSRVFRASVAAILTTAISLTACSDGSPKPRAGRPTLDQRDTRYIPSLHPVLADTIGQYAIFADGAPLPVEGYGIVAQLPGTGSGDMPPTVRAILLDQLMKAGAGSYVGGTENINPEKILSSNLIAAVEVRGVIPPMARKGDRFELQVNCLPSSQATSLSDGLLWTSELKIVGLTADTGNDTHPIALGRGPVFLSTPVQTIAGDMPPAEAVNSHKALRVGRVIGGGRVTEDRNMRLQLLQPSIRMTAVLERAINSRFPGRDRCAEVQVGSDTMVALQVPAEYQSNPSEFLNLVKHMFLSQESPGFSEHKAADLIKTLSERTAPRMDISIALQALGRSILPDFIEPQYTNPDPVVRFWCARAGAGLQDIGGMVVLQEFAHDSKSPFQKDAIAGIVEFSRGGDTYRATLTLAELLKSTNTADRVAAYEGLIAIHSPLVRYYSVGGGKFLLDIVPSDSPPMIYVSQSDQPRIALIGRPLNLPAGVLYVSPDNALTVSVNDRAPAVSETPADKVLTASIVGHDDNIAGPATQPADENVILYWRSPFGDRTVKLTTSTRLENIIARLGWAPQPKAPGYDPKAPYIGASYQRVAEMLASMCKDQTLEAQFVLQKLPQEFIPTPTDIVTGARPEGSTAPTLRLAPATAPATLPAPPALPAPMTH